MSISDRYREIVGDVQGLLAGLRAGAGEEESKEIRVIAKGAEILVELADRVGEIPRIRLEAELTPVLLKGHSQLDRARLLLEEQGAEDRAATVWEIEQKIYRLLNDL
ncbi:hypothetical protein DESUT3_30160 [Desulfuromonas versatilis]|uniref:Uncharacterized protein n=1 Tax=Desulfuromonas versatilis TaxID=2802975 RepID=A0ABN6E193_9BACT|nr:hypothetical protein [Desulfuromonas versatilis]BCR05947.1 hypothetical protein DESUT3_30160 [Desulfuromonas versatilis]